ncbi:MAG: hypothetical protein AAGD07_14700 [Planctomycetota bacterium]
MRELAGYVRATADETVEGIEDNVPQAVRDRKLSNELKQARDQIVDRRVQLTLAESKARKLETELETLSARVERRKNMLADAYPALQRASEGSDETVDFAGKSWRPDDLASQIDDLLGQQERDEQQLAIKRKALDQYRSGIQEGNTVISAMETQLVAAESEAESLKLRREQAKQESDLLELVVSPDEVASDQSGIRRNLSRLRESVDKQEAINEARRSMSKSGTHQNDLDRSWDRMNRLKNLYQQHKSNSDSESSDD